ncbi:MULTISPECIES: RHS repeat-associated core domain-containing protein [unclassified Pseudomonas]|uniref:RHS repeat-associated core domain-containing protein n=1 Tax=unclassified Pseudomonas TaxID=196821 RepID=UPI001F574AA3|nr:MULTISPECIES: RHS repeat-associated core domain-containing protein [unclassified Pseudomonas]
MNTHHDTATPTLSVMDPRTLAIRSVAYCRHPDQPDIESRITRQIFDAPGRQVAAWDPRLWGTAPKPNLATIYALSGQALLTESVDAGWQLSLLSEAGSMGSGWDARGNESHHQYDDLQRPITLTEQALGGQSQVVERWTYGEATDECALNNLCGQLIRHDDPAGNRHFNDYGLGGAMLVESRRFLIKLESPDWPLEPAGRDEYLEEKMYVTRQIFNPTGELQRHIDAAGNTKTLHYNVAGKPCATWLLQASEGRQPKYLVSKIRYNAEDKVESETAGNGVIARTEYNSEDGRLLRLVAAVGMQTPLQDLNYAYDPVGNIVSLEDKTQAVTYFSNQRVDPVSRYRYDSLYQLIEARGWEVSSPSHGPALPDLLPTPLDPNQRRNYTQTFDYDAAGNLLTRHHSGAPGFSMFTSAYSNRSLAQRDDGSLPGEPQISEGFDFAGNQLELQRGQAMSWDVRNQLRRVTLVQRQDEPNDDEGYVYDRPGHRLRKARLSQTSGQTLKSEVRYLPGLEVHREANGKERHVISVEAGRNQVRMLHWPDGAESDQLRYSLSDHLGSSSLELDDGAGILTQEHYYPFGGTACWAGKNALVAKYKTIRYSGKERDATGLYHYGHRYYAPWLQRWVSADPMGELDGLNLFEMVGNNPVIFTDEQGTVRGLSEFFSGESKAEAAKKIHFKQHLVPNIMARKETDKSYAILKVKKLARVDNAGAAEELLKAAVEVIANSKLTINYTIESINELRGSVVKNLWQRGFEPGFGEIRDGFEMGMYDYAHSPSKILKEYGSVDHPKFSGEMRPVYGALKLSEHLASAGGASSYGAAAFYLPDQSREYMTLTGVDSFDLKPSMNNLASFENLYPVFHTMELGTWKVLSQVIDGSEKGLESPAEYVEWQSHSAVSWKNMTDLVFQSQQDLNSVISHESTQRFLKKNSIHVHVAG